MKVSKFLSTSAALVGSSSKLLFLVRMADATTDAEHSNRKRAARLSREQKSFGILAHKSEGGIRGDVEFGIRELQSNACCSVSNGAACAIANPECYACVQGVTNNICDSNFWTSACVCNAAGGITDVDASACAGVCASNNCPPSVCCGPYDPRPGTYFCDPGSPFFETSETCPEDCGYLYYYSTAGTTTTTVGTTTTTAGTTTTTAGTTATTEGTTTTRITTEAPKAKGACKGITRALLVVCDNDCDLNQACEQLCSLKLEKGCG